MASLGTRVRSTPLQQSRPKENGKFYGEFSIIRPSRISFTKIEKSVRKMRRFLFIPLTEFKRFIELLKLTNNRGLFDDSIH